MATRKTEEKTEQVEEKLIEHAPEGLKTPSGKFVKHNPMDLFSARVIRREHWKSIGVHDQAGVEWNESNDFRLPVELFSKGALNYLLKRDEGFELVSE